MSTRHRAPHHVPPKRMFDMVVSSVTVLILTPLLVGLALWIYAHDRGPVLARQTRAGHDGRVFDRLSFRTTVRRIGQGRDARPSTGSATRLTAPGRVMRRSGLHELPGLLNVLRGDMSLVGPRPLLPHESRPDERRTRHLAVQPGLVGSATIDGRSDVSREDEERRSTRHPDGWSLGQDVSVLLRSARAAAGSAATR